MSREDNGSIDYKNDETSPSIIVNKSISEIDLYDFKIFNIENYEEDNNSFLEIGDYKSFGFPYNYEKLKDNEDEIDKTDLLFLKGEKNSENNNSNINQNSKKFKVSTKKRGRKKEIKLNNKKKEKTHTKYDKDNLLRKCQISYFDFMIDFLNIIIKSFNSKMKLNPKKKFFPIDYDIKKIVNRTQKIKLLTNSIEEMMNINISRKYSKSKPTSNKDLCDEIKQYGIPEIEKIFKKKFIFLFDIYHKSIREFNLRELDESLADLKIEISEEVELYKDMLNKNLKDEKIEEYKQLMESHIKNYFESQILFCTKA